MILIDFQNCNNERIELDDIAQCNAYMSRDSTTFIALAREDLLVDKGRAIFEYFGLHRFIMNQLLDPTPSVDYYNYKSYVYTSSFYFELDEKKQQLQTHNFAVIAGDGTLILIVDSLEESNTNNLISRLCAENEKCSMSSDHLLYEILNQPFENATKYFELVEKSVIDAKKRLRSSQIVSMSNITLLKNQLSQLNHFCKMQLRSLEKIEVDATSFIKDDEKILLHHLQNKLANLHYRISRIIDVSENLVLMKLANGRI